MRTHARPVMNMSPNRVLAAALRLECPTLEKAREAIVRAGDINAKDNPLTDGWLIEDIVRCTDEALLADAVSFAVSRGWDPALGGGRHGAWPLLKLANRGCPQIFEAAKRLIRAGADPSVSLVTGMDRAARIRFTVLAAGILPLLAFALGGALSLRRRFG